MEAYVAVIISAASKGLCISWDVESVQKRHGGIINITGWGLSYTAEQDPNGKLRGIVYSSSPNREAIKLLKRDVLQMMDLEQGRETQALFQKPARPLIKLSTVRLPELGGKEGQVKRRRNHYDQEERAQAELAEELDQDDEELVHYFSRLVGFKIWDFDENHNRYQIKESLMTQLIACP